MGKKAETRDLAVHLRIEDTDADLIDLALAKLPDFNRSTVLRQALRLGLADLARNPKLMVR